MKKLKIIEKAFRKLKLKGASSDPSIPQYPDALTDLEYMMADLDAKPSVNTGYNFKGEDATLDEESGLLDSDLDAISSLLAMNVSSDYGIEIPLPVRRQARAGLSDLMKRGATLPTVKYTSRIPRGLGNLNKGCNYRYNNYYKDTVTSSNANQFFLDSFVNWPVDFSAWLLGEDLTNVVWVSEGNNIKIENETFSDGVAIAKLTFNTVGVYKVQVTGTSPTAQTTINIDFAVSDKLES